MLGGSFWVAVLRNCLGACLMMSVFLLLDHPRFSMKKTVYSYILFGLLAGFSFSAWYMLDKENYVRFAGMLSIPVCGLFCILMSGDNLYLAFYKIALGFYSLAFAVFVSIDTSRIFFGGNIWWDIIIRTLAITEILFSITIYVRKPFLDGIDYLREEMDLFSAITVILSILIAALCAYWPGVRKLSASHVSQLVLLFVMAGIIQYLVFQFYLHRGKERHYQIEKELLETNERLIQCQLEMMRESKEELARIRHDARHHCLLIEEYIHSGDTEKLLAYVQQYREELESRGTQECFPAMLDHETINHILSVYTKLAQEKNIEVAVSTKIAGNIPIKDTELVAVIANIFENAIHGCSMSFAPDKQIQISIMRKGNKIVIQCKNTCAPNLKLKHGLPVSDKGNRTGISSILRVVSFYHGEAAFNVEKGMFIVRILLNIPRKV